MEQIRILLLEDSPDDAALMQATLKRSALPCQVQLVSDRESFTEALNVFVPDIIVSDHRLPGFNSSEALVIARGKYPHIPFILVTGTVSDEFAAGIMKSGADDYILKDRLTRLPVAIEAALKKRKAIKELTDYKYALDESAIVAITDQKGIIIYANDNFSRISKYQIDELVGQDHRIINSGYHPASFIRDLWVTIANGHIWRGEFCNKAKDGSLYWVDTTIIPFLNENGKPYQYLSIRIDITEQKIAEEQLKKTEENYRKMMERVSDAFVSLDMDWNYTYVNNQAAAILGRDAGELTGKNIWEEFPEAVGNEFYKAYHQALEMQQYVYLESFFEPFDAWLENHIYPSADGLSIFFRNITDKKKAELQVKESEEKYRTLFMKSPLPTWIYDQETLRFLDVNEAAIRHYGYTKEEFLRMDIRDIRPKEDEILLLYDIKKISNGESSRQGYWRHLKKNGELMLVETTAHSIEYNKRKARLVVINDITEKIKAEQELLRSRMRLNQAQEVAHLGNWTIDLATNISSWSDEAYRIYGLEPGDHNLSLDDWMEFVHPQDLEYVKQEVDRARMQLTDTSFYHRIIRKDGTVRYLYTESKFEFDKDGKPTGLYGIALDVTESKKAEQDLRDSEMQLKKAQAIGHIGNWEIDLVSNIHTWSDEFFRLFGLQKNQDKPSTGLFLSCMHPEDAAFSEEKIAEAFQSLVNSSFEFRFIRKDGVLRYGYTEWQFEFDRTGKPVRLFGILQDITERKEAEENIRLMEEKMLEQRIQQQKKIARAIISGQEKERNHIGRELHDNINQILAGTKMFLGTAAKKNPSFKEAVDYPMQLLDTSIEEIRILCRRLVTPGRNVNLEQQLRELIIQFKQSGPVKADLTYSIPAGLLSDDLKLNIYRIMQEQLNNITKYANATQVHAEIKTKGKHIVVNIEDDGIGFDLKAKRDGIGIFNMINRVESFNGHLKIKTSPGTGCRLTATIPC